MTDMDEDLIRQVTLFAKLPDDEIRRLVNTLKPVTFGPHSVLFREGDAGQELYMIRSGQIEIIKAYGQPDQWLLSVRGPGEYIGEMSLLNRDGLRTATALTRTAVELLIMTRQDFDALLGRRPGLAYDMVRIMSQRLSQANDAAIRDLRERNLRLEQAYDDLKSAQDQLIEKEKLEHELQVARQVQASLLPQTVPLKAGWTFAAHWEPAREVAGDFYDFISGSDGQMGVVIADVADKGMPSALFMAVSRSILRASLTRPQAAAEGIYQANRLICADSSDSMFVTLAYAALDLASGRVTYLNAGHNPVLYYQAAADHLDWLSHTGMPLGIDSDAVHGERSLDLAPGDFLLLYTDGVPDALNAQGSEFGDKRLWQLVYDHRHDPAGDLLGRLKQALAEHVGDSQPVDDITIVAIRHDGEAAAGPDLEAARRYALGRLRQELSPKLFYHSLWHTEEDVLPAVERLAARAGIEGEMLMLLRTAALFHDLGFVELRAGHEAASARIAGEALPGFGYAPEQIRIIQGMIMATRLPQSPQTPLEAIVADADLDALGRTDFTARNQALRAEMAAFGSVVTDQEWNEVQLKFVSEHHYFTPAAKSLRDEQKRLNIHDLKVLLNQD